MSKKSNPKSVLKFGVFNLTNPKDVQEEKDLDLLSYDYIPFGDKVKNDFPQHLAELKRKSATHRAILSQKTVFTLGTGFICENEKLKAKLEDMNSNDESFMEVFKKVIDDYYTFGNAYIEVVTFNGGFNMFHVDATKVRVSKDKENVIIHPNWSKYNSQKNKAQVVPFYPAFVNDGGNKRSIIHIKDYEPEFNHYGLPDYVAALESISVDYEIGRWNNTKFKNHFQPSSIVEINGDMSDEEAENLVEEAKSKFTGEGNNGKILFLVKNGDSSPASVTTIQDNTEGSFLDLQTTTHQNIISSHRWQPALSGIVSSGKMSNTGSEIRIAYEMVMNTIVKGTCYQLLKPIKKVWQDNGLDTSEFMVKHEPPISFMSDITISDVLEINELRACLGYEAIEGYDKLSNKKEVDDEKSVKTEDQNEY
jgi:hypothetical protein